MEKSGRALEFINLYRWTVALLLTLLHLTGQGARLLEVSNPTLFLAASVAYLGAAALGSAALALGWRRYRWHVYVMAAADIGIITTLAYASAGVASGLGMLLILPLIGAAMMLPPRMAGLIAAVATLALLAEETYRGLSAVGGEPSFTQAGILGVLFFVTALAGSLTSQRTREAQALAERQSVDLANLAQLNERILRQMQTGVLVIDAAARIRMANNAARALLGNDRAEAPAPLSEASPALAGAWLQWQKAPFLDPKPIQSADGNTPIMPRFTGLGEDGVAAPTLIMLEDERRVGERAQHMKLAALGQLTASIAHEIRNPLGAISHASQLLGESEALDDPDRRLIGIIRRHSGRINQIIENVLRLSRRDDIDLEPLSLAPWLAERTREFRTTHGDRSLVFELGGIAADAVIHVDRNQLHQVLTNLWDNAVIHAGREGARVIIRMRSKADGQRITLDVIDNGPGVPADVRSRIFEPFYTTARMGTGLGLYIAREICEGNNGTLSYVTDPDTGGGFFRMSFAAAPIAAEAAAPYNGDARPKTPQG